MTYIERWSLDEVLARYELEPELNDFFVEGKFDVEIFERAVSNNVRFNMVRFYDIDCIDVPMKILSKYKLSSGNKQRVIALAHELSENLSAISARCVVDSDLDHWTQKQFSCRYLINLSVCSIECFFLDEAMAELILKTTAKANVSNFPKFYNSLQVALIEIFSLRLADHSHNFCMRFIALDRYLSVVNDELIFKSDSYIKGLLNANSKLSELVSFNESFESWKVQTLVCPKKSVRGHDYTTLLAWSINKLRGVKSLAQREAVERLYIILAKEISDDLCSELFV